MLRASWRAASARLAAQAMMPRLLLARGCCRSRSSPPDPLLPPTATVEAATAGARAVRRAGRDHGRSRRQTGAPRSTPPAPSTTRRSRSSAASASRRRRARGGARRRGRSGRTSRTRGARSSPTALVLPPQRPARRVPALADGGRQGVRLLPGARGRRRVDQEHHAGDLELGERGRALHHGQRVPAGAAAALPELGRPAHRHVVRHVVGGQVGQVRLDGPRRLRAGGRRFRRRPHLPLPVAVRRLLRQEGRPRLRRRLGRRRRAHRAAPPHDRQRAPPRQRHRARRRAPRDVCRRHEDRGGGLPVQEGGEVHARGLEHRARHRHPRRLDVRRAPRRARRLLPLDSHRDAAGVGQGGEGRLRGEGRGDVAPRRRRLALRRQRRGVAAQDVRAAAGVGGAGGRRPRRAGRRVRPGGRRRAGVREDGGNLEEGALGVRPPPRHRQ